MEQAPEIQQLRSTVRDLVALSAVPTLWVGREPPEVAQDLVELLLRSLQADLAYVRLPDRGGEPGPELARAVTFPAPSPQNVALVRSIRRWLAQTPATDVLVVEELPALRLRPSVRPIGLEGEEGLIVVACHRDSFPTELERAVLGAAVTQMAVWWRGTQLLHERRLAEQAQAQLLRQVDAERERWQEEARTIETLHRVGALVAAELDLDHLVQAVMDAATELSGAAFGAFFYNAADERGEAYTLYALSGVLRDRFADFPMPRNTAIFGPTFRGEGVVRLADVTADPRYGHNPPFHGMPAGHLPVRSYLAVPVTSRSGDVLGGLFLGHPEPGVFTARAERLVVGVAGQAAIAIDNARLYQQAQQALEARDSFYSLAAHELKTPLAGLQLMREFISLRLKQDAVLEPGWLAGQLQRMQLQISKLTQLAQQLLDVSRAETGKLVLTPAPIDLGHVISEVVAQAQFRTQRHTITVHAPTHLIALVDPLRFDQVVTNLVENAIRYSPDGGPITVALDQSTPEVVRLVVEDRGQGVAPPYRERIFERTYQIPSGTQSAGLGLGLFICRQIVEAHGGRIWVEAPPQGGSRFVAEWPLTASRPALQPDASDVSPGSLPAGQRPGSGPSPTTSQLG